MRNNRRPRPGGPVRSSEAVLWLLLAAACSAPGERTSPDPDSAAEDAAEAVPVFDGPTRLSSSHYLGLLPDGEEKRRFLLDCTGCHVFDGGIAFPEGTPRTEESWAERTAQMVGFAGVGTGFPVISAERDPATTAAWLAGTVRVVPGPSRTARAPNGASVEEFDYPPPGDLPHDLVVAGDGRVRITGMFSHRIWTLDPATGSFTEEPIGDGPGGSNPRAIDVDAEGALWAVLGAPTSLARRDPATGEWRRWQVGMYPHSVAIDPRGRVWFNGHFTKDPPQWGYVSPDGDDVSIFDVPVTPALAAGNGPMPYGLRAASDGAIWGTELIGNRLLRFDPEEERFDTWTLPTPHSGPRRPDIAPDGFVWIPEYANNRLARFDPSDETFTEYVLPIPDALPYVVRVDQTRGTVWIGTAAADAVLSFHPGTERFAVYPLPTTGALVRHLDIDERTGEVWAAYGASPGIQAKIARIRPATAVARSGGS